MKNIAGSHYSHLRLIHFLDRHLGLRYHKTILSAPFILYFDDLLNEVSNYIGIYLNLLAYPTTSTVLGWEQNPQIRQKVLKITLKHVQKCV